MEGGSSRNGIKCVVVCKKKKKKRKKNTLLQMQSAICLDRACHSIAESQIGLLRNSRETYTEPPHCATIRNFYTSIPVTTAKLPSKPSWRCLTRRILEFEAKPEGHPTVPIFH